MDNNSKNALIGFDNLKSEKLRNNLYSNNYLTPTEIQRNTYHSIFSRKSIIVGAPTGSGKTLAFTIPIIDRISSQIKKFPGLRALILVPTYELTKQIWREFLKLTREIFDAKQLCFINKSTFKLLQNPDTLKIKKLKDQFENCKIIISSPVRLIRLLNLDIVNLQNLSYFVVDECDKMMERDIGSIIKKDIESAKHGNGKDFFNQIANILLTVHQCRSDNFHSISFSFFSATPDKMEKMISSIFPNNCDINFESINLKKSNFSGKIHQELKFCANEQGKLYEITSLLKSLDKIKFPCLIFLESRERAKDILEEISAMEIPFKFSMISSSQSESQREKIINSFREGSVNLLICTGLMARGIDFKNVCTIINYDMPITREDYIHKVGRTGRFNSTGYALTLWTNADMPYLKNVLNVVMESSEKNKKKYQELSVLVDAWITKRAGKINKKRSLDEMKDFHVSNRRSERKFMKKAHKKICLDQNQEISSSLRPWVPNRLKIKELPSSRKKTIDQSNE